MNRSVELRERTVRIRPDGSLFIRHAGSVPVAPHQRVALPRGFCALRVAALAARCTCRPFQRLAGARRYVARDTVRHPSPHQDAKADLLVVAAKQPVSAVAKGLADRLPSGATSTSRGSTARHRARRVRRRLISGFHRLAQSG